MALAPAVAALALSVFVAAASTAAAPIGDRERLEAQKRYEAGQSLMSAESFEEAVREFKAAIALDPLFVLAHYSLGQAQMSLKRYPDAIAAYVACRDAIHQAGSLDLMERTTAERRREDELRALKDSVQFARSGKDKSVSEGTMLRMEERIRFLENSRMTGDRGGTSVPAELSLALGSAYFRSQKLADAEREYLQAIQADKRLGSAHNNLAVIYMLTGRLKESEAEIRLAEKSGFNVSPRFKDDLKKRMGN